MKLQEVNQMMVDCWKFYKRYHEKDLDSDWGEVVEEAEQLRLKYNDNHFANEILTAVLNEIDRVAKSGEK